MKRESLAVLGPMGTFTERAAIKYKMLSKKDVKFSYYPTMRKTIEAIGSSCELGILPIENTLDGYVQIILDLLMQANVKIIHEVVLPIRFAFIANTKKIEDVNRIYVQFKTENQCLDFIEKTENKRIVTTSSNSESYEKCKNGKAYDSAIIPVHMLTDDIRQRYPLIIEDVTDSKENETRFLILSQNLMQKEKNNDSQKKWKTLLVIHNDNDRPGLLVDILHRFAEENINLLSIISRPTKKGLGSYNFFIDIEGCYQRDGKVREIVEKVMGIYSIQVLGSYYRVEE